MAGAAACAVAYGVDAIKVRLNSATYTDESFGGTASCSLTIGSSGNAMGGLTSYAWKLLGNAADYDIMATLTSGSLTSGTTGSWLNLGLTQQWTVQRSSTGTKTAVLSVQIREAAAPNAILATATVTITAQRYPAE